MNIGLTLPFAYLAGIADSSDAGLLSLAFGKPDDCLRALRDHGVSSIEVGGTVGPACSGEALLLVAKKLADIGLRMSLHNQLIEGERKRAFSQDYASLIPALEFMGSREPVIVVMHAATDAHAELEALVARTAVTLARLSESIRVEGVPVLIALELTRDHGITSPGTTYDNLCAIAKRVQPYAQKFCWDLGHAWSNVSRHKLISTPPLDFIENVIHTHIHAMSDTGKTHWPLSENQAPLANYIRQLHSRGYQGAYNLELYPSRWAKMNIRDKILGSVMTLQRYLV